MEQNEICLENFRYESPEPKAKGVWVELSPGEVEIVKAIGQWRYQANRSLGYSKDRVGLLDDVQMDIDGFGAELAFCKLMNIYPDLVIGIHPDPDCVMYDGTRVDVKQTRSQQNSLLAKLDKIDDSVDAYALVLGSLPRYRVFGIATKEELINEANITDLGYGPTYKLEQKRIKDIKEFIK